MTSRVYRLQRSGKLLIVRASVGRLEAEPAILRLLVDTGASQSGIPLTLLTDIGYSIPSKSSTITLITGNGLVQAPIVHLAWLNCLGQQVNDFPVLGLHQSISRYFNGILGMDFLSYFNAVIDIGRGEILLP